MTRKSFRMNRRRALAVAGLGGEVMQQLGVNAVLLPPGAIFSALQTGAIDAAEWTGPLPVIFQSVPST